MPLFTISTRKEHCCSGLPLQGFSPVRQPTRHHAIISSPLTQQFTHKDCTGTGRTYLMDCESGAAEASKQGVTQGTNVKYASSWNLYLEFLAWIKHNGDPYLEELDPPHHRCIFGAFLHAQQQGDLGSSRFAKQVIASTAKETIDHVAATFVSTHRKDPIANTYRQVHEHIRRQISGYRRFNSPVKHHKDLPPIVF